MKDCWLVIHGKVYDVTTFLEDHPGGEDVLLHASASGDATKSFEEVGHSSTATSMMQGYLIGTVEGFEGRGGLPNAREGRTMRTGTMQDRNPPPSSFLDYILPVLILAVAFGAWYYLTHYTDKA
ncbi:hypothetical protein J5N97_015151 [Dioscorea zingiberensis]|uniref:Cytochrome b5 heme-binding domain-containing protein n=1 Tax=Dioscorea zingiberensis TaxID=325984 RepID=A0A9D5CW04_9LILI|nr:hypothetical protein J5N97_015151 [Dioscorea zingiberensis]